MVKVKKHAYGGTYYVRLQDSPKLAVPIKEKRVITGWNIPELRPEKSNK